MVQIEIEINLISFGIYWTHVVVFPFHDVFCYNILYS